MNEYDARLQAYQLAGGDFELAGKIAEFILSGDLPAKVSSPPVAKAHPAPKRRASKGKRG